MQKWQLIVSGILLLLTVSCGSTLHPYPGGVMYDPDHPGYVVIPLLEYQRIQQDRAWMQGKLEYSPYR